MTNVTAEQLEQFESTFKAFDKDQSNTLQAFEFKAVLASLGQHYAASIRYCLLIITYSLSIGRSI